jgi:CSLREA domain-containing protein
MVVCQGGLMQRVRSAFPLSLRLLLVGTLLPFAGCIYEVNSFVDAPDETPGDYVCASPPLPSQGGAKRCTLRAAIMEANAQKNRDIVLVPAGTYQLSLAPGPSGGSLKVSRDLKLVGRGEVTIEQTISDSVVEISGGTVDLYNLLITGGDRQFGGGIFVNSGTVKGFNLNVNGNFGFTGGGGVFINSGAALDLYRTTIQDNEATGAFGGGAWNKGLFRVFDSTIERNRSNRAGGIRNEGILNLRNVTVSGNEAISPDAGVGGISQNDFAYLNNVTLFNNKGVGNSEASFRGGGIQTSSGKLTVVKNSILAGNDGGMGPDDCVGALTFDSRNNLVGSTEACSISGFLFTYLFNQSPVLGTLTFNGGLSRTHLPGSLSPVISAGYEFPPPAADACELFDLRGVPRPQGNGCDLGAVERTTLTSSVLKLVLVNADTEQEIRTLVDGDVLVLDSLPPNLSIKAEVGDSVGSVVFAYDSNLTQKIENVAPYFIGGDTAGDSIPFPLSAGNHSVRATPFATSGGTGAGGVSVVLSIEVI